MIISHKHKFIFIKTQKTAGTSIETALAQICGETDIITPLNQSDELKRENMGYRGAQNYTIPFNRFKKRDWYNLFLKQKRPKFHEHMSAEEIMAFLKKYFSKEIWDTYFKFCFERDPYDKVVSFYFWKKNGKGKRISSIYEFLNSGMAAEIGGFDLYSIGSVPAVDKVYPYEELMSALKDISRRLGLKEQITLPKERFKGQYRTNSEDSFELLSEKEVYLTNQVFAREFEFLSYPKK